MDTTTVLAIIKMIDTRHSSDEARYTDLLYGMYPPNEETKSYFRGKAESLDELRNHLQSFIEGQLNAEENETRE
jgi:hypothetical protein